MKTQSPFAKFAMTLLAVFALWTGTPLSAQGPTEAEMRLDRMSQHIHELVQQLATKEEVANLQKGDVANLKNQVAELEKRVNNIGQRASATATEMRVMEVLGTGAAFVLGVFVTKIIGQLMPGTGRSTSRR